MPVCMYVCMYVCIYVYILSLVGFIKSSSRAISITAPRLWNGLSCKLRNISLPPPPLLPITRPHIDPAPLSITPRPSTENLKQLLYSDSSDHLPSQYKRNFASLSPLTP